ncbi:MAG: hypothetical protein ABSD81_01145 [Methanomicrobiales archaeon]|jgi:hypothetical protein
MNQGTLHLLLVLLFGGLLGAALPVSPLWYLIPPLFIAFLAVMVAGRRVGDPEFLVLCIGELLVVVSGTGLSLSILPLQCLLIGVILAELHLLAGRKDVAWFGVYTLGASASLALILGIRNVLVSGIITGVFLLCIFFGLTVREHEQQRVLAGGSS